MSLYKRKTFASRKIEIIADRVHCEDIGLYAISQNPKIEYDDDGFITLFTSDGQWSELIYNTIIHTVSYLLINRVIELHKHSHRISFLWETFNYSSVSYTFRTCGELPNEDIVTRTFLTAISDTHRKNKVNAHANSRDVVMYFIDKFSGKNKTQYETYSSNFLIQVIKQYATKYSWLTITKKPGIFSFFIGNENRVDITRIFLPRISMQINDLVNTHNELIKSNWDYSYFMLNFLTYIKNYFSKLNN